MKRDLDNETKIFTALGFGDKQTADPFLDSAWAAAYSHRTDTISLNASGQAVVKSEANGHAQPSTVIDFSDSEVSLPKSMHYNVKVDNGATAHVDLSAANFASTNTFNVHTVDRIIEGSCSTRYGISDCTEAIKDSAGNLLLRGHTVADITRNPNDFHRTVDYSSPSGAPLGRVTQHVILDAKTNTLTADTVTVPQK
jgi:hypothetical protein